MAEPSSGILTTEQVLSVGQKLFELRPLSEVLDAVLTACASAMRAETAMVFLKDEQGLPQVAAQSYKGAGQPRTLADVSSSMLDDVFAKGEPVLTESAIEDPRFSGRSSIILQGIQSAVIMPLSGKGGVFGAIYLDSRSDRTRFLKANLGPLSTLAAFSTLAIENARRYEHARRSHQSGEAGQLVGSSPAMQELFNLIERVAGSDLPALILGESGTGKELAAREIHTRSPRKEKPFLALYCGNVSDQLFESELFGHKKGSFTGATADKQGLVEAAAGGSLFLDEVADIPADLQTKLLRFLQEGEYRAVGDTKVRKADVRIITATNRDLRKEVREGRFRDDLFYRLYILPVTMPPLRARATDVPHLVRHFLDKYAPKGRGASGISPDALRRLTSYGWPGNVRELENTVARAMVVARGDRIEADDVLLPEGMALQDSLDDLSWKGAEKRHILFVLNQCGGNKSRTAEVLGISRRYLHYRLKEWEDGIESPEGADLKPDNEKGTRL
ncbi:MAG TPA: sigma-54-dependent Fis family transcriptional regulator [bacterium]|jgi:Nif-specific regulatory protein